MPEIYHKLRNIFRSTPRRPLNLIQCLFNHNLIFVNCFISKLYMFKKWIKILRSLDIWRKYRSKHDCQSYTVTSDLASGHSHYSTWLPRYLRFESWICWLLRRYGRLHTSTLHERFIGRLKYTTSLLFLKSHWKLTRPVTLKNHTCMREDRITYSRSNISVFLPV